jgi:hypothetical protein
MIDDDAAVPTPEPEPAPVMSTARKAVIGLAVAGAMVFGGFGLSVAWAQTSPPATGSPSQDGGGTGPRSGHCHHGDRDRDSGGTVAPDTAPERTPNPST